MRSPNIVATLRNLTPSLRKDKLRDLYPHVARECSQWILSDVVDVFLSYAFARQSCNSLCEAIDRRLENTKRLTQPEAHKALWAFGILKVAPRCLEHLCRSVESVAMPHSPRTLHSLGELPRSEEGSAAAVRLMRGMLEKDQVGLLGLRETYRVVRAVHKLRCHDEEFLDALRSHIATSGVAFLLSPQKALWLVSLPCLKSTSLTARLVMQVGGSSVSSADLVRGMWLAVGCGSLVELRRMAREFAMREEKDVDVLTVGMMAMRKDPACSDALAKTVARVEKEYHCTMPLAKRCDVLYHLSWACITPKGQQLVTDFCAEFPAALNSLAVVDIARMVRVASVFTVPPAVQRALLGRVCDIAGQLTQREKEGVLRSLLVAQTIPTRDRVKAATAILRRVERYEPRLILTVARLHKYTHLPVEDLSSYIAEAVESTDTAHLALMWQLRYELPPGAFPHTADERLRCNTRSALPAMPTAVVIAAVTGGFADSIEAARLVANRLRELSLGFTAANAAKYLTAIARINCTTTVELLVDPAVGWILRSNVSPVTWPSRLLVQVMVALCDVVWNGAWVDPAVLHKVLAALRHGKQIHRVLSNGKTTAYLMGCLAKDRRGVPCDNGWEATLHLLKLYADRVQATPEVIQTWDIFSLGTVLRALALRENPHPAMLELLGHLRRLVRGVHLQVSQLALLGQVSRDVGGLSWGADEGTKVARVVRDIGLAASRVDSTPPWAMAAVLRAAATLLSADSKLWSELGQRLMTDPGDGEALSDVMWAAAHSRLKHHAFYTTMASHASRLSLSPKAEALVRWALANQPPPA